MKSIPLTQEQINQLYQNPYTALVTANTIKFTLDFKVFALREAQSGTKSNSYPNHNKILSHPVISPPYLKTF